ncbi:hypothetical protein NNC19_05575 [Clostridium sp. SHJSY1]|uniref:hypothetical protein n=1 Tax=Clostridium sp. SHJSY1 TaxID=2942483 RepID=UPI0028756C85|nr:hypothetical protein [Clostridium sp. SHJSY1]MDS0525144.1 hypothetical protein [Clostridium sp. SHJSY1]
MKKLSLKVMTALVAISLIGPTVSTSAVEVGTKIQGYKNSEEWKQNKDEITSKKDTIKKNHETNKALREDIVKKRDAIKNLRKEIKDNNKKLTKEELSKIKEQIGNIKTDKEKLEGLKGVIKKDSEIIKDDLKNKNFADAKIQLDNIISTQNTRTDDLKKLNTDLDTLINIVQSAVNNTQSK